MSKNKQIKHERFKRLIWDFYAKNRREFPWRNTRDPYRIMVSELMLQQTQAARVVQKYHQFLKKFPTVKVLARARPAAVISAWQGLGYNRRALFLHRAAISIVKNYNAKLPKNKDELRGLPGIGPYTAAAIATFTQRSKEVFLETNIRRVFIDYFFKGKTKISDARIFPLIQKTLPSPRRIRDWYWALMDYGSRLPKIKKENANLRSRHYIRQSKFEGSRRQLRGAIIRLLAKEKKNMTLTRIKKEMEKEGIADAGIREALDQLTKDGMMFRQAGRFSLPNRASA